MPSLHLIHWYEGTPSALKKAMNCDVDPMLLNKKFRLTNKTVVERVQLIQLKILFLKDVVKCHIVFFEW